MSTDKTPMEVASKKRSRRANLKKILLDTVATAGVMGVALIAPNAVQAMEKLGLVPGKRQNEIIKNARQRLVHQGLLSYADGSLRLTKKGQAELRKLSVAEYAISHTSWDGKWRMLIFDIPEKRRGLREQVRQTLLKIGFIRLQDSVWLFPYDCEDLVTLLKADFRIGRDLLYIIADAIEYDTPYKKHFGLS